MTAKDAAMFPVMGSAVLFGLYLLFKYLDKDLVNLLLTAYFLFFGLFALIQTLSLPLRALFPSLRLGHRSVSFTLPWDEGTTPSSLFHSRPAEKSTLEGDLADACAATVALLILAWYPPPR